MLTTTRPKTAESRSGLLGIYRSDVGKKYAMAISGVLLLLFVFAHMVGNLHAFEGPVEIDEYGEALRGIGEPLFPRTLLLWVVLRLPVAIALVVHVHAAYALTRSNQRARAGSYDQPQLRGGQLRLAHHAVDRGDHPAVPGVAPRRLHLGRRDREPRVHPRRGL